MKQTRAFKIWNCLDKIDERLDQLETTIENMQEYSYWFNIKLLGIPELKENEDAFEANALCVRLFNQLEGNVTINNIDLDHRTTPRKATSSGPKPIVCKCTRRLAMDFLRRNAEVWPAKIKCSRDLPRLAQKEQGMLT